MSTLIHQRVRTAQDGTNPNVIARVRSGWVVIGDVQFLAGYCVLLADPVVVDLNALAQEQRVQFLSDMAAVGDALLSCTNATRINYEILGNVEPALHAHIFPRYANEPEVYRSGPVWLYDKDYRRSIPFDAQRDRPLMDKIAAHLEATGMGLLVASSS